MIEMRQPNGGFVILAAAWDEILRSLPDVQDLVRISARLLTALGIGACIGLQREMTHHSAGLRTHMLVALGTALLIVSASESGMDTGDVSRIIQGVVTGIGFLGGGAILKLTNEKEIHGLTTAAGIWMTAAAGAAAGLGRIGTAIIGTMFTLLVLGALRKFEKRLGRRALKDSAQLPGSVGAGRVDL